MAEPARPTLRAGELLRATTAGGVDFIVIGGVAAVLHGSAMSTYDLDICFATDAGNLRALGEVVRSLGARLRSVEEELPFVPDARTLAHVEVLTLVTAHGELDVLARPAGTRGYESLRRRAERVDLGGFSVLVASIDDLIVMKQAAGRRKDLLAVDELEAIRALRGRTR